MVSALDWGSRGREFKSPQPDGKPDDSGLPWTLLDQAADPSRIKQGAFVIAGHDDALAVAQVVDVDADGVVHLRQVPGPVSANLDRLTADVS